LRVACSENPGQDAAVIAEYAQHYRFCPRCGQPAAESLARPIFTCPDCGFVLFFNPSIAAAALIFNPEGKILVVRRAKDPGLGKLAFPGGFIDADETAEDAVRREVREEVGMELDRLEYLCSFPNRYPYRGVTYIVLDFFFLAWTRDPGTIAAPGEVQDLFWADPGSIRSDDLAFVSLQNAWGYFRRTSKLSSTSGDPQSSR
jgi:mutator protein MutT